MRRISPEPEDDDGGARDGGARRRPGEVRRVALFGETGIGNFGNEASLVAGIQLLEGTGAQPVAVAQRCADVVAEHGVEAVDIRRPGPMRHGLTSLTGRFADVLHLGGVVRSVDAVIVPGTGIFEGRGVRPRGIPFSLFWLAAWSRWWRRPLLLLSVGVDDAGTRGVNWFFARVLAWSDLVTVRDRESARAVAALGVRRETPVVPDLVLGREPVTAPCRPGGSRTEPLVAVGVMDWGGTERDAEREVYTGRSVALVRALLDAGMRVRVVIGEDLDHRVAAELVRRVRAADAGAAVELGAARTVEDVARSLEGCHALVAARHHNLIAAVSEGVPVVATGYSHKQASLVASYGPADRAHHRDTYDAAQIVDQVREILDDHAAESARVREVAVRDRAAVRAQAVRVRAALGLRAPDPVSA